MSVSSAKKTCCVLSLMVCLWFGVSPGIAAEENKPGTGEVLTLQESIKTALENNPKIVSSAEEIKAAENVRKQARSEFLFKMRGSYSYTRLQETPTLQSFSIPGAPTELAIGTQDNFNLVLSAEQPVFAGFAILTNYQISELGLDIAKIQLRTNRHNLIRDVTVSYFDIILAEKRLIVAEESVRQLESQVKRALDFFEVGMTPRNDYLKADVELAQAKQEVIVGEGRLRLTKAQLNTLLRVQVNKPVQVEDLLKYVPFEMTQDDAYQIAHKNRPELVETELALERAVKEVKLAQSGFYPNLLVNFTYERFGDTFEVHGSDFEEQETWYATAALDWTFWEWGKTKYRVGEKKNRVKQAKEALRAVQDSVDLEVKRAYVALRDAERNISVTEKAIEQAKENYRMEVERYKQQVNTNTDVLEAETLVARSQNNYHETLYLYNTALVELKRAMGVIEE